MNKLETLREFMAAGDWDSAINFAGKFPTLGKQAGRIQRVAAAQRNPDFYREIGHDPVALRVDAIAALKERFGDPANNFTDATI